jgi:hypothetical protein
MTNKALGGGPWQYDASTGAGQQGIAGACGLNNIGLLVTVWGGITEIDPGSVPTWLKIDDGSGVNVKCLLPPGFTISPNWHFVGVTGASSCEKVGNDINRLVLVRDAGDIVAF